jgi:hypothetical protein
MQEHDSIRHFFSKTYNILHFLLHQNIITVKTFGYNKYI